MKNFFGKKSHSALTLVFIVSLVLHVVAVLIFGTIKFVESVLREETVFEAAPVETPQQKEPEYQVNIQQRNQSTPPPRPPAIVVNNPSELNIPALDIDVNVDSSSVYGRGGGGFGGGLSGVREMALDIKLTDFGYTGQVEGTLKGSFFDTKVDPRGKALLTPEEISNGGFLMNRMGQISKEFTGGNWRLRDLERDYFKADKELYASYWMIQKGPAEKAPRDFGVADQVEPKSILALYEGTFTPEESGEFRFYAKADDILIVRVNSDIVVDGSYYFNRFSNWKVEEKGTKNLIGIGGMPPAYGDWMRWEAGKPMELKVLVGEAPGGVFGCCLLYQKKGEDRLRVFSTKPLTSKEKRILKGIHPDVEEWL
ncbi:hypothetical protein [Coraliomargarita sinensis]|nr:hypothetical protein [Coraliomargarita sinensis]